MVLFRSRSRLTRRRYFESLLRKPMLYKPQGKLIQLVRILVRVVTKKLLLKFCEFITNNSQIILRL